MKDKKVSYGIKDNVIKEIVNSSEYDDKCLIAEGKPSEPGQDAEIITTEKYKERKNKIFNDINSLEQVL